MTEFESYILSEYLVGTWLVDFDKQRSKESETSASRSLWIERKEKERSQLLSLMLKLLAITKM